jgi:hypothetical protein
MKRVIMGLVLVASATLAHAESWTCSPSGGTGTPYRFTVLPPVVTWPVWNYPLHIVQNDEDVLITTGANSDTIKTDSRVFIRTLAINKITGEYGIAFFEPGEKLPDLTVHGKCLKD